MAKFFPQNELVVKRFWSKFGQFINQTIQVTINWITKIAKGMFSLKDKNHYPTCQIYKGTLFVVRHILVKSFGTLRFDGMSMRTYIGNLNLQKILRKNLNHNFK